MRVGGGGDGWLWLWSVARVTSAMEVRQGFAVALQGGKGGTPQKLVADPLTPPNCHLCTTPEATRFAHPNTASPPFVAIHPMAYSLCLWHLLAEAKLPQLIHIIVVTHHMVNQWVVRPWAVMHLLERGLCL